MTYTLYTFPGHIKGNQCIAAAKLANIDLNVVLTSIPEGTRSEEFKARHGLGKVPYLETPEGSLFEANAIIKYFGRKANLLGSNSFDEARVNQWLDWINGEFQGSAYKCLFFALGHQFGSEELYKQGKAQLLESIKYLNQYLNEYSYLARFQLTIADVALVCLMAPLMYTVIDESFLKGNQSIFRWYKHILSFEGVKFVLRQPFVTKKEWVQIKADKKEGGKKGDKKQQDKQQPKKQQQQKAAKKEEKAEDKPAKAPKNEFEALPPTSFNLFDFKTFIVNEKDKQKGVAEFWNQFDPEGFSIWHVKYDKLESECKKLYLTSNLKDTTMQRLDNFRKYAFGTFGVYGEENDYDIEGVWVWRGTGIPELLKEQPNFEYHKWTKLDHTKESDKKLLEEYWTNMKEDEDKVQGRVARDVQYFK